MGYVQSTKYLASATSASAQKSNNQNSQTKASKELGVALEKLEREKRDLQEEIKRLKGQNEELQ